jgi:hypothetical protein
VSQAATQAQPPVSPVWGETARPPQPEPAPAAPPVQAAAIVQPPPAVVDLDDAHDDASDDDIDYESSTLVGAKVVQDVLGGRVIEEGR